MVKHFIFLQKFAVLMKSNQPHYAYKAKALGSAVRGGPAVQPLPIRKRGKRKKEEEKGKEKGNEKEKKRKNKEQVAQGQYVVSDTLCPALSDCEME